MSRTIRSILSLAFALAFLGCAANPPFAGLVPTPDGSLFVRTSGAGPDLVLLHGLGDSSVTWRKLELPLQNAGFRVTVFDALGAGRSDKPQGPYDIDAHVRRLDTVLEARGIRSPVLVGNSLGGSIALRFATLHPESVRALVLISPAAYAEGGWTGTLLWELSSVSTSLLGAIPPHLLAQLALHMNFGDPRRIDVEDVAVYAAEAARDGAIAAFVQQQRQIMPTPAQLTDWIGAYREIRAPVLVLWGTRDRILDPELGPRLCRELRHAELVSLPGIGHAAQLEAPGDVVRAILDWLQLGSP